jgi:hypothetical protein
MSTRDAFPPLSRWFPSLSPVRGGEGRGEGPAPRPNPPAHHRRRHILHLLPAIIIVIPIPLLATPAHATLVVTTAPAPRWESAAAPDAPGCVERLSTDEALDQALRALTVEVGGEARPIASVRITGLATLPENDVWKALGGKPEHADAHLVAVLLRRLSGMRVFARVVPVVRVAGREVSVDLAVIEQPTVRKVVFEGLDEVRPERLLEPLFRVPPPRSDREPAGACVDPLVPAQWLARAEGDAVRGGLLEDGPQPALTRALQALHDQGYAMAALAAELSGDGVFTVHVDEGRLEAVEVRGVAPRLEPKVRARLDLRLGRPFQASELDQALGRVQAAFPFLRRGRASGAAAEPQVQEQSPSGGVRRFRTVLPSSTRSSDEGGALVDDDDDETDARRWYLVEGHRVVVLLAPRRFDVDLDPIELIRHTPVTGFAPGLVGTTRLWDPGDEVHLGLDLGGNVNTNRAHRAGATTAAERWRVDWLVGGRVQLPRVHVTELGVQRYSKVDTSDRWRIDRLDSYLYSALFNRPVTDYFHRNGFTAFLTTQWLDHVVTGVEYRQDRYASLESIDRYFTLFYRHEPPRFTRPVTEGEMRSVLFRVEYSTQPTPAHEVRGIWRDPERALASFGGGERWDAELRTVNTLEVADPELLGGDPAFHFVRIVSDTVLDEPVREHHRIRIRFRAAGRLGGGTLPLQKEEALGGWTALRGYDFKELGGGNFSLLGTVEYRFHEVSVFFDGGQVRQGSSFTSLRVSGGLALNLGRSAHLDVAWRLDDRARLTPVARFFFQRTF